MTTTTPIQQRFSQLQQQGRCALMPFLMAGDPDLSSTRSSLLALQAAGADMIELGIPYSDPLADGAGLLHGLPINTGCVGKQTVSNFCNHLDFTARSR